MRIPKCAKTTHASHTTDVQSSDQAYEFMIKWLGNHPQFISNKFYVGGDSYSGNPVPIITQLISDGNGAGIEPYINLKGYVLGNPLTFPEEVNYHIRFANGMGLISDELYKCVDGIQLDDVLEPYCGDPRLRIKKPTQKQYRVGGRPVSACEIDVKDLAHYWADDASVRKALHIREIIPNIFITVGIKLAMMNESQCFLQSTMPGPLLCSYFDCFLWGFQSAGHGCLFGSVRLLRSNSGSFKPWALIPIVGIKLAMMNESQGAGHTAPTKKPEECLAMFKRWISYQPL
ncbi:serine carboxypeptidase-like 9 [Artemisia annua]|uniref:Serine carboxypeptidase-like 9 n=1 Tax=Artemisia annua TaxID=35608 RepID=A0A2U1NUK1_ARTAN|nr:serine carboxypeptidase-like 9 [Artemisia annua]